MRKGAEKLQKFLNSKQQGRLDGFFTVKPKEKAAPAKGKTDAKGKKRKVRTLYVSLSNVLTSLCRGMRKREAVRKRPKQSNTIYFYLVCPHVFHVHQYGLLSYLLSVMFVTYRSLIYLTSCIDISPCLRCYCTLVTPRKTGRRYGHRLNSPALQSFKVRDTEFVKSSTLQVSQQGHGNT